MPCEPLTCWQLQEVSSLLEGASQPQGERGEQASLLEEEGACERAFQRGLQVVEAEGACVPLTCGLRLLEEEEGEASRPLGEEACEQASKRLVEVCEQAWQQETRPRPWSLE